MPHVPLLFLLVEGPGGREALEVCLRDQSSWVQFLAVLGGTLAWLADCFLLEGEHCGCLPLSHLGNWPCLLESVCDSEFALGQGLIRWLVASAGGAGLPVW